MIHPTPTIPQEIVNAVNNDKLVVFIGAGVSRSIGCASWEGLAQNLVTLCSKTKGRDGSFCINYKQKETLSRYHDPKKIITICHQILQKNRREKLFFEELKKSFNPDPELLKNQNVYDELQHLPGIFITTNTDEHFDEKFCSIRITYKKENFNPLTIDTFKLFHIHGSISDPSSLIFTVPEYIKRYRDDHEFIHFMKEIFNSGKYVVLFVGYGIGEFELLEFLISKFDSNDRKEYKHFILLPYYKGEENIRDLDQLYYDAMGLRVIGYEKDVKGYGQLYDIIKGWNSEIRQLSTYLSNSYHEIEDVANNYEKKKAERVFQIIKDKPLEDYLFRKLASSPAPFPWLKPLGERDYFKPVNNPSPQEVSDNKGYFTTPYWNILGYLKNVATQNAKKPSDKISNTLLDIVNSIIDYRNDKGERIENYMTDWSIVKIIFTLPIGKITKEHIEFIRTAFESKLDTTFVAGEIGKTVLPKLIESESTELILKLMDIILDYKKIGRDPTGKYTSLMEKYWLNEALKKYKPKISKLCGIEAAKIAIEKMLSITREDESQFNTVWIPAIEDHPQTDFPDRYECQLVHFVRDMFEGSKPSRITKEIKDLLKEDHPIFKRIALHAINYQYEDLNKLFWEWESNPLEDTLLLKHEVYELLKANCSTFSEKQIKQILKWIESKEYYIRDDIKDDQEQINKILAYRKKEWVLSLLETKDKDVILSYEKYQRINSTEIEHPGFDVWHYGARIGEVSPIEEVILLNKSNKDIAEYLFSFIEEGGFIKPSQRGLSETFRNCVAENPEKFAHDMKPFLKVQRIYQYALLWGLYDAWRSKKSYTWKGIFNFISQIIEVDSFWTDEYDKMGFNYKNMIIGQIANFIKEGIRDDRHTFNDTLLPQAENILLIFAEKTESDFHDMMDLVTSVLNSLKGKIFSAMISYSLRHARLHKQVSENKWVEAIKEDFDKRLDRELEPTVEFSVTLGEYLLNLYYLDKEWVIDNINKIFLKENVEHWKAAFTGYLFHSSSVNKDIYFLLRDNGHYEKGIQSEFGNVHIIERLVQHICVGYFEDFEKIDDNTSLIIKLIENNNDKQLSALVSFFWMLRNKLTDKVKRKVKPIWGVLIQQLFQNMGDVEYQKIIAKLSEWLCLIDEIDEETVEWLKLSAKYQVYHDTSFFIEYLLEHVEKTPTEVGKIYLEMLNTGIYPMYKTEDILEIVSIIYGQNKKEIADRICNLYLARGYDFLKAIFEKNREGKVTQMVTLIQPEEEED